jgi:hypothetical protein
VIGRYFFMKEVFVMAEERSFLEKGFDKANAVLEKPVSVVSAIVNGLMRDGTIAAGGRQGIDELGQAIKAFPDAIQAHAEPGGMFEPLHSDIAAARDARTADKPLPSPSQVAGKGQESGTVHGPAQEAEKPRAMTPGELAKDGKAAASVHGPAHQADKPHTPTPSEIGKDRGESWKGREAGHGLGAEQDKHHGNEQHQRERGRDR